MNDLVQEMKVVPIQEGMFLMKKDVVKFHGEPNFDLIVLERGNTHIIQNGHEKTVDYDKNIKAYKVSKSPQSVPVKIKSDIKGDKFSCIVDINLLLVVDDSVTIINLDNPKKNCAELAYNIARRITRKYDLRSIEAAEKELDKAIRAANFTVYSLRLIDVQVVAELDEAAKDYIRTEQALARLQELISKIGADKPYLLKALANNDKSIEDLANSLYEERDREEAKQREARDALLQLTKVVPDISPMVLKGLAQSYLNRMNNPGDNNPILPAGNTSSPKKSFWDDSDSSIPPIADDDDFVSGNSIIIDNNDDR